MKGNAQLACGAAILAGGRSARMGTDKSRLRMGRRTLVGHVRAAAREAGFPPREIRRDTVSGMGPLGGVLTALESGRWAAELFLACDMPFVTAPLLRWVVDQWRREGRAVFVALDGRLGFPFVVPRVALSVVRRQVDRGELSVGGLAEALGAKLAEVPVAMRLDLFNVNTEASLVAARRKWEEMSARE